MRDQAQLLAAAKAECRQVEASWGDLYIELCGMYPEPHAQMILSSVVDTLVLMHKHGQAPLKDAVIEEFFLRCERVPDAY